MTMKNGLILAAVAVLVLGIWWHGKSRYSAGFDASQAQCAAQMQAAIIRQAAQAANASADYQAAKTKKEQKERVRYVQVQKIIDRPVYHEHCFDADGVQLINQAVADGN